MGITFDGNGRMFVWEKGGKVFIVENGIRNPNPLIDISDEVGNWRDFGLLGFALDPEFLNNGFIYLLYLVDRHHLLHYGSAEYDPQTDEYFNATIGRLTRYTAEKTTNFTTIDYSSRKVLLGETKETGFPSLHESHGTGSLVFGTDGTLMVSLGDGASYTLIDEGSALDTYHQQALEDGIITPEENVGAYRCQLINSLNGKILRIDPKTGAGLPTNPYFEPNDPYSVASRVWAIGVRNPYRMTLRPNSGSHERNDGNPGVFYFGDVGWERREELNVLKGPGKNFGWPKYEGMTHQPGYNNSLYKPLNHTLPAVDWRRANEDPRGFRNGAIYTVGSPEIPGPDFKGNCSTGGVWYTGDDFPTEYKNTYFHADYGANWIHNFVFDENDEIVRIRNFDLENGSVVFLTTHPLEGGLYYIRYGNSIHRIDYQPEGNQPPVAVIETDRYFGPGPLTVTFDASQSYDPEGADLTYQWDFGNGPESNASNPTHTFEAPSGTTITYSVRLTVQDSEGLIEEKVVKIYVNNTPPMILSTSIDNIDQYSVEEQTNLTLNAVVSDSEHSDSELTYEWQTILHHDNHTHAENPDPNQSTTTIISPVGCDSILYYYQVKLKVTDPEGLSSVYHKNIYPDCGGPIAINDETVFPAISESISIAVLSNDLGSLDAASVEIIGGSSYGSTQVDQSTGAVTYTRTRPGTSDSFTYIVKDPSGKTSNVAGVSINKLGAPSISILNPAQQSQVGGTTLVVQYEISGAWKSQGVDRLVVTLDGQTPYQILETSGSFVLNNIEIGDHTLSVQLSADGLLLSNAYASDQITFKRIQTGGGSGLMAKYYNNLTLNEPYALVRQDPGINFNWGNNAPEQVINQDKFSVRWEGQVQALYNEQYTFYTKTDDGVRLYLNGHLIIDQWIDQGATEFAGSAFLQAGEKYPIVMEYYENSGEASAELSWSSLSQVRQVIPEDLLFSPELLVGLPDPDILENTFTIYPNPASKVIYLTTELREVETVDIELKDLLGKSVYREQRILHNKKATTSLDLDKLYITPGIYLLKINSSQIDDAVKPVVIIR